MAHSKGGGTYQRCNCCFAKKPARLFYWASSRTTDGARRRYRDKTCKECRKSQRAQRYAQQPEPTRTRPHYWADPLAARFLSLRFVLR